MKTDYLKLGVIPAKIRAPVGVGVAVNALARGVAVVTGGLLLSTCAVVDQFEGRIYSSNLQSQNAMNQETLVNVIRASRFQTMNFVALTQVTGGQTETLTTGLPTVTFGPAQTVAQHQFQVTNSLSSAASGGFQSNPLVSTTFQSAMLSPVSPRTVALLAASHPREPVFYSLLEAITLSDGDFIVRFENDPTRLSDEKACAQLSKNYTKRDLEPFEAGCNYPAFVRFLRLLLTAGLTSELLPVEGVSQKDAPQALGHLCFDRSRAVSGRDAFPICGAPKSKVPKTAKKKSPETKEGKGQPTPQPAAQAPPSKPKPAEPAVQRLTFSGVGTFDVAFSFRSPVAVYKFYGTLFGQLNGGNYRYASAPLRNILAPGEPFINIVSDGSSGCYASIGYGGETFCVPSAAANTALIFTILQELRNLSIQSTDLNAAFTVRLSN